MQYAIWLARMVVHLLPAEPEAAGLLALLLYSDSRRAARRDDRGNFVPLAEQATSLWSRPLIAEAEQLLRAASQRQRPGRYQLEAAIQSVHAARAVTGQTHWRGILNLYHQLLQLAPTVGGHVACSAALVLSGDPQAALRELAKLPAESVNNYQPFWAAKAQALMAAGRPADARTAFQPAAGLTQDEAVRRHLLELCPPQ